MNLHANAALSLNKRRDLRRRVVDDRWTLKKAQAAEVSERCARKWVGRYRVDGELGLLDRSSAPRSIPHRTSEERVQAIAALRSRSCAEQEPSTAATGSRSSSSSRITAAPTSRSLTPWPAARSASATDAHAPTAHRRMERQRDSSAGCSAAGPTARSIAIATSTPQPLTDGSGTTTIIENTRPSATSPRSLASASEPTFSVLISRAALNRGHPAEGREEAPSALNSGTRLFPVLRRRGCRSLGLLDPPRLV
jgi:hypothetical protein